MAEEAYESEILTCDTQSSRRSKQTQAEKFLGIGLARMDAPFLALSNQGRKEVKEAPDIDSLVQQSADSKADLIERHGSLTNAMSESVANAKLSVIKLTG